MVNRVALIRDVSSSQGSFVSEMGVGNLLLYTNSRAHAHTTCGQNTSKRLPDPYEERMARADPRAHSQDACIRRAAHQTRLVESFQRICVAS